MPSAHIVVDRDYVLSQLDRRVFGAFVEHMGRCVYTGIYEPGHPTADEQGFRQDVAELTRELGATIIRYPGGNFVSGYNWEDGVGPVDQRPRRLELAWDSLETNAFGTNEFIDWCNKVNVEPMFAVNLGTRGADDARRFLEYCNYPSGTELSDLRRSHGYDEPHNIRFWCLGNEMDGPWQIGAKTAEDYGLLARETAKVMRSVDGSIELTACGSSNREMPTFGRWEYEVLDHCFEQADFISLHTYFEYETENSEAYLTNIDRMDAFISEVVSIADAVAATRRSTKRVMLAFDEWNSWVRTRGRENLRKRGWPEHPPLIEEVYTAQDALLIGGALITLMNHADRVKNACIAQLVNVIGPIMTEPGGPAWRQTIFHPFALSARYGRGSVLRTGFGEGLPPHVYHCVTRDDETGQVVLFILNGSVSRPLDLRVDLRGFDGDLQVTEALEIHHEDLQAVNTKDAPDTVTPKSLQGASVAQRQLSAQLKASSWNVLVLDPV